MRAFIAVPLPPEVRTSLAEVQAKLRAFGAPVRWTAASSIHLTLKFLGEINPAILPELTASLRSGTQAERPFTLHLQGLGGFPNLRIPHVIWCGLTGDIDRLEALQQKVETVCTKSGFAPEERPFRPHLTLGRVRDKRNMEALLDFIKGAGILDSAFEVAEYHLYESILRPQGAQYVVRQTVRFQDLMPS
jgi:RNA 2',3'-cyclic 3'-phosphodiesterase